jgi:hypothetical protein
LPAALDLRFRGLESQLAANLRRLEIAAHGESEG